MQAGLGCAHEAGADGAELSGARILTARDLMLGIQAFGASRAFLYERVIKRKAGQGSRGFGAGAVWWWRPDGQSVRAFRDRIPGIDGAADFYRITGKPSAP